MGKTRGIAPPPAIVEGSSGHKWEKSDANLVTLEISKASGHDNEEDKLLVAEVLRAVVA